MPQTDFAVGCVVGCKADAVWCLLPAAATECCAAAAAAAKAAVSVTSQPMLPQLVAACNPSSSSGQHEAMVVFTERAHATMWQGTAAECCL